jgi:hypothetical protein
MKDFDISYNKNKGLSVYASLDDEAQPVFNEYCLIYRGDYVDFSYRDDIGMDKESQAIRYLLSISHDIKSERALTVLGVLDDATIQGYMDAQRYDNFMMIAGEMKKFDSDDKDTIDARDRWFHMLLHGIYVNSVLFVYMDSLMYAVDESWYTHVPESIWLPICRKKPNLLSTSLLYEMHTTMSSEFMIEIIPSIINDSRSARIWVWISSLPAIKTRIIGMHDNGHDIHGVIHGLDIYEKPSKKAICGLDAYDNPSGVNTKSINDRILRRQCELLSMRLDYYESAEYRFNGYLHDIYVFGKGISRRIHDLVFDCQMSLQGNKICQAYLNGMIPDGLLPFDDVTENDLKGMQMLHDYILSDSYNTKSSLLVKRILNYMLNPRDKDIVFIQLFLNIIIVCNDRNITMSRMFFMLEDIIKDKYGDSYDNSTYITQLYYGLSILSSWVDSDDTDFPYEFYKENMMIMEGE